MSTYLLAKYYFLSTYFSAKLFMVFVDKIFLIILMIFVFFMGEMGGVNTKILFLVKICLGKIIFGETFVGKIF